MINDKVILVIKMNVIMTGVCNDLKNRGGCGHGSHHEKFMKENCKKTCGLCGMFIHKTNLDIEEEVLRGG